MASNQAIIDRAVAEIGEMSSAVDSAVALMDMLSQLVRDNIEDPTALAVALDAFDAKKDELAAAVARNTPSAEEPPPAPEPTPEPAPEA